ncbi:MAG: methylmalonyl-CoA epimerase [Chitinophagaceae bacterium]|nr:MAG: methylmalonyl-CoA epimerase [Chitinophagaceae bacterium]
MEKIEHIGIAVENLEKSMKLFEILHGAKSYKTETVDSEKVITAFFRCGESKIELLQGTDPDSPISKFISKRGEGIHHIAFDVKNLEEYMQKLKASGIRLLNETPKKGADNKLICFLHPKDTNNVLIELCQDIP